MKKNELNIRFYDDYGEKNFSISSIKDGMYYLWQRTWDGKRLRYNSIEGIVEFFNDEKQFWDVHTRYIYQLEFFK